MLSVYEIRYAIPYPGYEYEVKKIINFMFKFYQVEIELIFSLVDLQNLLKNERKQKMGTFGLMSFLIKISNWLFI